MGGLFFLNCSTQLEKTGRLVQKNGCRNRGLISGLPMDYFSVVFIRKNIDIKKIKAYFGFEIDGF